MIVFRTARSTTRRARRLPARRSHRGGLIKQLLTDFRDALRQRRRHGRLARADRGRARDRGRALHGAAFERQGAVRHAGPRGGFTGWMRWERRPRRLREGAVDPPPTCARSRSRESLDGARRGRGGRERRRSRGSIVQPSGVLPPARAWCRCATRCRSAGAARRTLAIPPDEAETDAGKDAHFDPRTRKLTALRSG